MADSSEFDKLLVLFIILLFILMMCIMIMIMYPEKCEPKVIYMAADEQQLLDLQFSKENLPTIIYRDMFAQSSPWIGGYQLGDGKTYIIPTPRPQQTLPPKQQFQKQ